ncbi:MAG: hypothetical protein KDC98_22785 [Planctomycetes bacterium]|nr:hypothetical protein [Planctomycetota bacterium]
MREILHRAIAAVLLVPPVAAQWGFIQPQNRPPDRDGALLGYDLPNNRMLMFGGNWSNDLWSLQNGVWTQLQPNPQPPSRTRGSMAVDSISGTVVLYGGDGGTRYALDDTWEWNGTAWSQATSAQTPGGLALHGMAFDLVRQTTVLFGGRNDSWIPNQQSQSTWEFSNGNWTNASPAASPPARVEAAMCYHPALNLVFLFGGEDSAGMGLDDTWTYDGTSWLQINATGPRPSPRAGSGMVPVLTRNLCVLTGGRDPGALVTTIFSDTWEHDGVSWRLAPAAHGSIVPARQRFAMAHDIVRDRIVAFGGVTVNNALQSDTWEYGAHWRRFGTGCAGSAGVPALNGGVLPQLGQTCDAALANLPTTSSLAFMAIGLSRQQWSFGTLPALLTNFGMPGCRAYTSADVLTAVPVSGGVGQWSWNVPSSIVYIGAEFHLQGLVPDASANAAGLTVSNAATMVLGW